MRRVKTGLSPSAVIQQMCRLLLGMVSKRSISEIPTLRALRHHGQAVSLAIRWTMAIRDRRPQRTVRKHDHCCPQLPRAVSFSSQRCGFCLRRKVFCQPSFWESGGCICADGSVDCTILVAFSSLPHPVSKHVTGSIITAKHFYFKTSSPFGFKLRFLSTILLYIILKAFF